MPQEGVNVTISAYYKNGLIFKRELYTKNNGFFGDIFPISFGEPDGVWDIQIVATDKDSNGGIANFVTNISTPKEVAFYTVTFLSPLADGEFKRGSIVPITVEVKDAENPVENAIVDFRTPSAQIIKLNEINPGTYTAEYKISSNDPIGKWYVGVQAVKSERGVTKAGGTKIQVTIRPASINLVLLSPTSTRFFAGIKEEVKISLSYTDGTMVENADVFAKIGNETIRLTETKPGIYSSGYLFTQKDIGTNFLQVAASDVYKNSAAMPQKAIRVDAIGKYELKLRLFYYNILARFWYLWILAVLLMAIATRPIWHRAYLKASLKKTIEDEKRVIDMEKNTQLVYFKEHSIKRADYDKLMYKYREQASNLKEKKLRLEKKLRG